MVNYKPIIGVLLLTISTLFATAQNNTNSPYTRFGYGELSNQSFANSRGMAGVAYGMRDRYHINAVNPASYTAVDSLTFLFEGGVSIQNTNFVDGITKLNAGNSSFDYVAMQFRLHPRFGMSLGLLPYSNVGYSMSQSNEDAEGVKNTESYYGEGGLHQAYLGLGFKILKNFSVGANFSYFWGDITRTRQVVIDNVTDAYPFQEVNYLDVKDIKLDFGAQYTHNFDKKRELTLGVVFSPKHDLNNDAYLVRTTSVSEKEDTPATYEIPMSLGAGLSYRYDRRLTVGLDYNLQKWGSVTYMNQKNAFYDRSKIAVGLEFLPTLYPRNFFSAIKYRVGAYYATPYYKLKDANGAEFRATKEYGASAGLTLPIPKSLSRVSLAAQYVRIDGQRGMMSENCFRLSIGVTFNERWFFKRKVD
ncbi:porin family protein [Bacteroides sp. 224]|uniref:porin family protein n=1 Tax=Bacteroides sp. 224 TaxID=2302936 RepID=UPI0013D7AAFA|nr:porin family protein [Bacteroides sp. 224]NDV65574.1 hypothetical protein [Bacteroides sp. 224]